MIYLVTDLKGVNATLKPSAAATFTIRKHRLNRDACDLVLKKWIARRKPQSQLGLGDDFQRSKALLKDQSAPSRLNQCFHSDKTMAAICIKRFVKIVSGYSSVFNTAARF
jgi:hypothetical protein